MDAMIGNMRSTFGNGVRKMFSNSVVGAKNNVNQSDKASNDQQVIKMPSLCSICGFEGSTVPFIVRDICKFISQKCMKLEGIFRVSASLRQVNELRVLYESNTNITEDLLLKQDESPEVIGHAAAGLLKQFFRQLSEPLIHEDVLCIFNDCKTLSDKDFSDRVSSCMNTWLQPHRSTLLYLLSFLHTVAQESENRMSVNGLGVVFGPNVFELPDGIEGLQAQTIANQAFERLLSCSYLLCKNESATPPTKRQPPPRPAPPIRRPLPPTPGEVSPPKISPRRPEPTAGDSPVKENVPPTVDVPKPVPAVRKSNGTRLLGNTTVDTWSEMSNGRNSRSPRGDAINPDFLPENGDLPMDIKAVLIDAKVTDASDVVAPKNVMPRSIAIATIDVIGQEDQKPKTDPLRSKVEPRVEAAPQRISPRDARSSRSESEEIPENILERSDSMEDWQTDSGNNTGESKVPDESCHLLDSSIRAIVRTRLFNSTGSASSMSDDAESLRSNGLLPSTTAGRVHGPRNRRRPSRKQRLLNNVQLDNSDDEDITKEPIHKSPRAINKESALSQRDTKVTVTMKTDYDVINPTGQHPPMNSDSIPSTSAFSPFTPSVPSVASTSVTTVTTPDSGCIVDDYPRNSSPIKSELARLDIGRGLSPVHIPKLNLRNSLDEEEFLKMGGGTSPPCFDLVPQLDLSSVTESADREAIKPVRQLAVHKEQAVKTPPRPAPRQQSASKHGSKKKRKKHTGQKKTAQISEVTPQVSDSELLEQDCDETMEQTRDRIVQNLRDNRKIAGRPFDITKMAHEDLKDEKLSMQRELLKYEGRHGRPTTKESKQLMREVYDRYRAVKRLLAAKGKRDVDENENTIRELNESFLVTKPFPIENMSCDESDVTHEGVLDTPTSDLLHNLRELRVRRKRLRRILRDFENERKAEGSNLERRVMRSEYEEYRTIKSKVRELEIALARKGVEIF